MAEQKLFYFPYVSLTNQQLPLLKVAALYIQKYELGKAFMVSSLVFAT